MAINMKDKIRQMLEEALPLVDLDSDFLFSELDSLGITTVLMILSDDVDTIFGLAWTPVL